MCTHLKALAVCLSLSWSVGATAASDLGNAACPSRIGVAQAVTSKPPAGWSDYGSKEEHPFMVVSFFVGPPDQKAALAPGSEKKHGKERMATWKLPKSDTDYWIACEYAGTTAVVARALGKELDTCRVFYDNRFSTPVAKHWDCQGIDPK